MAREGAFGYGSVAYTMNQAGERQETMVVDALNRGSLGSYLNHACAGSANCQCTLERCSVRGRPVLAIRAKRDIADRGSRTAAAMAENSWHPPLSRPVRPGEPLLFDYFGGGVSQGRHGRQCGASENPGTLRGMPLRGWQLYKQRHHRRAQGGGSGPRGASARLAVVKSPPGS